MVEIERTKPGRGINSSALPRSTYTDTQHVTLAVPLSTPSQPPPPALGHERKLSLPSYWKISEGLWLLGLKFSVVHEDVDGLSGLGQ